MNHFTRCFAWGFVILAVLVGLLGQRQAIATTIYWTDAGKIQRANLDGSNVETFVVQSAFRSNGLALDIDSGNLYMTLPSARPDLDPGKILRVTLEPVFTIEVAVDGLYYPFGIALSGTAGDLDDDNDGVPDAADQCPATPLAAVVNADGCAIDDLCPCSYMYITLLLWRNHRAYISCVTDTAVSFVASALITETEKDTIVLEARLSSCGRKKPAL